MMTIREYQHKDTKQWRYTYGNQTEPQVLYRNIEDAINARNGKVESIDGYELKTTLSHMVTHDE